MESVSRQEHQASISRVHDRIEESRTQMEGKMAEFSQCVNAQVLELTKGSERIETTAKLMKESVDKMHEAIFGNGKPGILTRLSTCCTKITVQWWLLGIIISFISGICGALFLILSRGR